MLDPQAVAELRKEYRLRGLSEGEAADEPFAQFTVWFAEILAVSVLEPTAMTLATATAAGRPSARMVLLKGFDEQGFVFYTNYDSRKGGELGANPVGGAGLLLAGTGAAGARGGCRRAGVAGGVRRLLCQPSPGEPPGGLGIARKAR